MARVKLQISKEISFPIDAITQTFAYIGRKGSGKTYLATMVAEQMLDAHAQTVIIDPVGVWWGLRISADGKKKGKEIFIIGGDQGDVPLVPEAGKRIAQLIVEKGISAVLDVSSFRIGERKRFCQDFGEEFFQLKKAKRTPVHLYLEEAQLIVPQNIKPDEGRMYSAYEQIVRLGRNYGIGTSLITQRPQSVNKEVLSQIECLCVLQVTGPHERKAIEAWVQEAGADRTLVGELPGLERGEGYVWSPAWLRLYQRVHFSKKETFDASATPEVGKKIREASLSAVDIEMLKKDIADVVEQAEKDDPSALRRKIADLEKQLQLKSKPVIDPSAISRAIAAREQELLAAFDKERAMYRYALTNASTTLRKIAELTSRPDVLDEIEKNPLMNVPVAKVRPPMPGPGDTDTFYGADFAMKKMDRSTIVGMQKKSDGSVEVQSVDDISGPEQQILDAILWMNAIGVSEPEKAAVAFVSGRSPSSSGFQNACGALRRKQMVVYVDPGKIMLTGKGSALAQQPDRILSNEQLQERILAKLPGTERRILSELITLRLNGNVSVTKEYLAGCVEKSAISSGFQNSCGKLRTLGLVEYPTPGHIKAADILFPLS